jgi:hypothetical protein|tara:strand:- start:150 stop:458 length:309 start_codon:yes stop_codon:yes gene_type:complete
MIGGKGKFIAIPISVFQLNEFIKHGRDAVRIFGYIKTKMSMDRKTKDCFVTINNRDAEAWFGLHQPHKWKALKRLEAAGLIEVKRNGAGKSVAAKIILPTYH